MVCCVSSVTPGNSIIRLVHSPVQLIDHLSAWCAGTFGKNTSMPLPDVLFIKGWVSLGTQICWMRAGSAVSVQGEWACALQAWPTAIPDQGMMEGKTAIGVTYKYHPAFHK